MNDDQLRVALRDALTAPEVTADRWAGQQLRHRARARQDARRGVLVAMSFVLVAVLAVGGVVGLLRGGGTENDSAASGGGGTGLAAAVLPTPVTVSEVRLRGGAACGWTRAASQDANTPTAVTLHYGGTQCVPVGAPVLTIRQVVGLRLVREATSGIPRAVQLDLLPEDLAALRALDQRHASASVGLVIDGRVFGSLNLRGPAGPIELQTSPGLETEQLYRRLGGQ